MSELHIEKDLLKNKQYKDASGFENRMALLEFANPKFNLWEWTAQQYDFSTAREILEVGCGTGMFWNYGVDKLNANHHLTLTDFSQGMLDVTKKNLANIVLPCKVDFTIGDVEDLNYRNASFDCVLADEIHQ